VIRVPVGAWNVWDDSVSRLPVGVVIRSLMPRVELPLVGQAAYELPAIVVLGSHASLPKTLPRAGSHETTV
jgi:hypothetical protein